MLFLSGISLLKTLTHARSSEFSTSPGLDSVQLLTRDSDPASSFLLETVGWQLGRIRFVFLIPPTGNLVFDSSA